MNQTHQIIQSEDVQKKSRNVLEDGNSHMDNVDNKRITGYRHRKVIKTKFSATCAQKAT